MEGRWTIHPGGTDYDMPFADGPEVTTPVPVVPCDDAAIERAAKALRQEIVPYDAWHYSTPEDVAEAVLRAAGETP